MRWLLSVKTLSVKSLLFDYKTKTFQSNISVVYKLIWLEIDLNLSYARFERYSLYCQYSTAAGSDITVRN